VPTEWLGWPSSGLLPYDEAKHSSERAMQKKNEEKGHILKPTSDMDKTGNRNIQGVLLRK
jgi:hypothetical protein